MVVDKGYDSEENHRFAHKLGFEAVIPVRVFGDRSKVHGQYRRALVRNFPASAYHQRSKVKTVFSVVKRCFGDVLFSVSFESQRKELLCMVLAYNVKKLAELISLLIQGFLRGQ